MSPKAPHRHSTKKTEDVRLLAARSLIDWLKTGQIEFDKRKNWQYAGDYTLYKHLVSSAIRHWAEYRFIIERLTGRTSQKLDREVMASLLLGLAQLEPDSKIQEHAALNETVELLSRLKKPYLKGFVNANLRRFTRERDRLTAELSAQTIDIQTSHPGEMVQRWEKAFGTQKALEICQANNILPDVQVAINPEFDRKIVLNGLIEDGFSVSDHFPEGLTIHNPSGLFSSRWMTRGAFLVQDIAFQRLNRFLAPIPKQTVLDTCSAPGGKLIHLEWHFKNDISSLLGAELKWQRLRRLRENIRHYRSKASLLMADAMQPPFRNESVDLVLLDVPCSGTGTIRKHPELKWTRTIADIQKNHRDQIKMISQSSQLVKKNGYLLYVTCSLEPEENEMVIDQFLKTADVPFKRVPLADDRLDPDLFTKAGDYFCFPSSTQMGCFAALLCRG